MPPPGRFASSRPTTRTPRRPARQCPGAASLRALRLCGTHAAGRLPAGDAPSRSRPSGPRSGVREPRRACRCPASA
jgi:hypothetical protein